ncbi:MAG: hypothetical protein JNK63_07635 [Chthonomonas sp.]|nr:hypothetical protein [Chthonomonas sp.]
MSSTSRLLWGSLLGALVVLLFHPASAPYYRLFILQLGPSRVLSSSPLILSNVTEVSEPKDKREAAFFLIIASRELTNPKGLNDREAKYAQSVATTYGDLDPENSFWRQMAAVFSRSVGNQDQMNEQWLLGADGSRWEDGQNQRLLSIGRELESEYQSTLSWQKAVLAQERNEFHANAISGVARTIRPSEPKDTDIRFASLLNGQLMLEGSRSMSIGATGVQIMREASFSGQSLPTASYAQSLRQRQNFLNALRATKGPEISAMAESLYLNADSWTSVVNTASNREDRRNREFLSALAASLPGPFVYLSLAGCLVLLASWLIGFHRISHRLFSYPVAPILGLVLGVVVFASTRMLWPALWAVLSLAFFVFQPSAIRSQQPSRLTSQHRLLIYVMGVILALCFVLFMMGLGAPMRALASSFGVPQEYQAGSSLLLGLCLLMLSIVVFSAPVWALIVRHDSVQLLSVALRELGRGLALTGIVGSVMAAPIAVWIDRSVSDPIEKTLLNEPNLYLSE